MLKTQWVRELESDKEEERQKFILNRERNIELMQHNTAERELRSIQNNLQNSRDKELLDAALAREKALAEIEENLKL